MQTITTLYCVQYMTSSISHIKGKLFESRPAVCVQERKPQRFYSKSCTGVYVIEVNLCCKLCRHRSFRFFPIVLVTASQLNIVILCVCVCVCLCHAQNFLENHSYCFGDSESAEHWDPLKTGAESLILLSFASQRCRCCFNY